jgi:hypothetical protein
MAAVDLKRPVAYLSLIVLATLAGCSGHAQGGSASRACEPDVAPSAVPSRPPVPARLGEPRQIPATPGTMSATVTSVIDPVVGGKPNEGCRWVGIGMWLRADGPAPTSLDLFATSLLVTRSAGAYKPTDSGTEGRDGIDQTDLIAGDERRGTLIFQVPAREPLRYLTVGSGALVLDLGGPPTAVPVPSYRPGNWPPLGTTHEVVRLAGEGLSVTPLRVLDPTPATAGVRAGYRAFSVQLRVRVTGTGPWPLNPEIMVAFVDSTGRQWYPGFVTTTSAAPPFDPLRSQPGQEQTAWVTAEIPGQARPVALMLSPYSGVVYAWRL